MKHVYIIDIRNIAEWLTIMMSEMGVGEGKDHILPVDAYDVIEMVIMRYPDNTTPAMVWHNEDDMEVWSPLYQQAYSHVSTLLESHNVVGSITGCELTFGSAYITTEELDEGSGSIIR